MRIKKRIFLTAMAASTLMLTSCSLLPITTSKGTTYTTITEHRDSETEYTVPEPSSRGSYSVTFVVGNGYTYSSYTNANEYVMKPTDPTKLESTFTGWYTDKDCSSAFNFNREVTADTVLYAGWDTDYLALFNTVSTESILANVRIEIENYDVRGFGGFGGSKTNVSTTLGSGVIFYEDSSYYYALTNNHVVYTTKSYQTLVVEDAYEHEESFDILGHLNTYDLALIRFQKNYELKCLSLADYTQEAGEVVFAMGEPEGLSNVVSCGEITSMRTFSPNADEEAESNVTFDVYLHSAVIQSGSSGGALLDSNLKLIGVNFASAVDSNTGEYKYSYAIPALKVSEFVSNYITID